jgi:hypothetical protein
LELCCHVELRRVFRHEQTIHLHLSERRGAEKARG